MAKRIVTDQTAMILHDDRFSLANLSTTYSSYNEGEPVPGEPQPSVKGWMDVEATGTASAGDDYDLETMFSGRAIGGEGGATFRWRKEGEAATSWRGFLAHNKVTGCQWVAKGTYIAGGGVALPDGTVVSVVGDAGGTEVFAYLRTAAGAWSQVSITTDTSSTSYPSIVRLPDNRGDDAGRLVVIVARDDLAQGGNTYLTLSTHFSDDDGATWSTVIAHASGLQVDTTNITIRSIDSVYHNGYITTVVCTTDSTTSPVTANLYHLVSTDNGASFELVETLSSNTTWRRSARLFVDPTGAVGMVYWLDLDPGVDNKDTSGAWVKKAAPLATFAGSASYDSAFTPAVSCDDFATQPITAGLDAEGFLWVIFRLVQPANTSEFVYAYRYDASSMLAAPDRWLRYDPGTGTQTWRHPIESGDSNSAYLLRLYLVPGPDGLLLLTQSSVQTGVLEVALGGYHSRDWQVQTFGFRGNTTDDRVGNCYLPTDEPSNISLWTVAGAGTDVVSVNGLDISTTANARSYQRDGVAGTPCLVMFTVDVTSGGSLSSNDVAVLLRRADNTVHYEAILRLTTTSAGLWDTDGAGSVVGTDATGLSTGARDWLFSIESNRVSTWYKPPYSSVWTQGPEGTLNDQGSGTALNRVQWGHLASATAASSWRWFGNAIDNEAADPGLTTQTAAGLQGRAWSQNPLYLDGGWRLTARGGPTYKGDTWDAAAASRYPVANVHMDVSPSPTVQWRSNDTTEQILAWELTTTNPTYLLNSSIGVALLRPNFRTALFEGRTAGGSWVTLITFDTAIEYEGTGGALTYVAAGDHVYPASGTNAGERAWAMDELRDGYAILESTGEGGGDDAVKILHNSEGVWRPGSANRPVDLLVAPVPTTGAVETNIRIIPPAVVGIVHEITNQHYVAFRLKIAASQATTGGFYHLGGIIAGPLALFAPVPGNGRIFRREGNVSAVYDQAGRDRVRQRGAPRDVFEFSWVDPVWTGQLYEADANPDYYTARNAGAYEGMGLANDARLLEGVLRRTDGGALPVVVIEQSDPANALTDQFVYVDPANFLAGRLFGPVTRQSVVDNNVGGGVYAINRVSIVEIK